MNHRFARLVSFSVITLLAAGVGPSVADEPAAATGVMPAPVAVRVCTFNVKDVRTQEVQGDSNPRVKHLAAIIQQIRPDILFINEMAYSEKESTARLFAEGYLAKSQGAGLEPIQYRTFDAPSNTGIPSGFDLDNNNKTPTASGSRDYGGDCLGYGEFPGQFAMALFVRADWTIDAAHARTFKNFKWKDLPGALLPKAANASDAGWYSAEELGVLPLSSKSHWDVPVVLADGRTIHMLCSHPTPPVFDGPEDRNGRRNHDEIRFWADYLNNEKALVDDHGVAGGLAPEQDFVIVGDLNSDPRNGDSLGNPIKSLLLAHPAINGSFTPTSKISLPELDPDDTSEFKLRVDYVLPSKAFEVRAGAVWRGTADSPAGVTTLPAEAGDDVPTDHFPVWIDLVLPPRTR